MYNNNTKSDLYSNPVENQPKYFTNEENQELLILKLKNTISLSLKKRRKLSLMKPKSGEFQKNLLI